MHISRVRWVAGAILSAALIFGLTATPTLANPAGPHLDGGAYDALRPTGLEPILAFNVRSEFEGKVLQAHIKVGSDFVVEEVEGGAKIYDFRFRRLIYVNTKQKIFLNNSLYGDFRVRWALLMNNMFASDLAAKMSEGVKKRLANLNRFLTEHANGASTSQSVPSKGSPAIGIETNRQDMKLILSVEGVEILNATLGPTKFPSDAHRHSFAAWLAWELRIHPKTAQAVAQTGILPVHLEFSRLRRAYSLDSRHPTMTITLGEITHSTGRLNRLSEYVPMLPEARQLNKQMTQLMVDAVHGRAPNGPTNDSFYIEKIRSMVSNRSYFDAALLALHASSRYEGCTESNHDVALCTVILDAFQTIKSDGSVEKLLKAISLRSDKKHEQALAILQSLRDKATLRPDILEFLIAHDLVEAKRASPLPDEALARELDRLPELLTTALAADPYSPYRYCDITNYFFVGARTHEERYGAHILEHFVLDLARLLPSQKIPEKIVNLVQLEQEIEKNHPILFPTNEN